MKPLRNYYGATMKTRCMFKRKVKLTREQAIVISVCLENYKRFNETAFISNADISRLEDILDTQIWGSEYVSNRRKNRGA